MVVRRSDSRRRRLVVDPSQLGSQANDSGAPASRLSKTSGNKKKDVRAYSYGADRRNVNKTTDLFPKRVVSYLLVVLLLLACLALINYGAIEANQWRAQIGDEGVSSLAISGHGSVASWFTTFMLILSSLASLQIFALRKHRCDDYRGTYRLWSWLSGVLLFASLCCIVNLGSIVAFAFESLTQVSFAQKPWLAPTIVISLLTILVARAVYEVRRSRGSMTWMVTAWIGYTAAILLQLPAVGELVLLEFGATMVAGNCVLLATAALLMAHLTYVRFIFLRAHGLIKLKAKKKKVAKKKARTKSKKSSQSEAKPKSSNKTSNKSSTKTAKSTVKEDEESNKKSSSKTAPAAREKKVAAKKTKSRKSKKSAAQEKDPIEDAVDESNSSEKKKSASDLLKELAAASRAKEKKAQSKRDYSHEQEQEEDYESQGVIKMSKAQRRKQRKQQRNRKRAA